MLVRREVVDEEAHDEVDRDQLGSATMTDEQHPHEAEPLGVDAGPDEVERATAVAGGKPHRVAELGEDGVLGVGAGGAPASRRPSTMSSMVVRSSRSTSARWSSSRSRTVAVT